VYEPGFTEDPEVVRDGGLCLTDGPDEVADAHLAVGRGRQYRQDPQPGRIGQGTETHAQDRLEDKVPAVLTGELTLRADSGFCNHKVTGACQKAGVRSSITAKLYGPLRNAIEAVAEDLWVPVPYWAERGADVAELAYKPAGQDQPVRLIVRRVKPSPGSQLALFAKYEYHPFITDRVGPMLELEADHRRHAEVELVIKDLKQGPWAHMPSGRFGANAAWLALGAIAHNLARWSARLGKITEGSGPIALATLCRRYISVPGHLSRSGRRTTLHLAKGWPWAKTFLVALATLRSVAPLLA
jgi:hypothetical protein